MGAILVRSMNALRFALIDCRRQSKKQEQEKSKNQKKKSTFLRARSR